MSDKTCVTCGKGVRYIVTCSDREHQHAGLHQPDDTCQDYVERTDSVEQVALDALTFAKCLMNTGCALDSGFADYEAEYAGEQSRFTDIETSLRLRLRALGVEVPQ